MSREEIEKLSERLLSFANHIDRKRCAEATETDADNARDAAQALTALLAENERLRGALREARPIVGDRAVGGRMITPPAEAGRVLAAIIAALNKDPDQ